MNPSEQYKSRARSIKIKMFAKGLSQSEVARQLKLTHTHVNLCLNGRRQSNVLLDKIEEMIDEIEDPELEIAA